MRAIAALALALFLASSAAADTFYGLKPGTLTCDLAPTDDLAAIVATAISIAGPCRIHDAGTLILLECVHSGFLFTRTRKTCEDVAKYRSKHPGAPSTTITTTLPRGSV